jgi:hypothetical protein
MNRKLKIALLGLLGLSTAACCSTKKTKKSQDNEPQKIEAEEMDPRIQLMYGVRFPDGQVARPVEEDVVAPAKDGVPFPDGSVAKGITEVEAAKRVEELRKEEAAKE